MAEQKPNTPLGKLSKAIDDALSSFFERLGHLSARCPGAVIAATLLFFVLTMIGTFTSYEEETRGEKLWVPHSAPALDHLDFVEATYERGSYPNFIIQTPADSGSELGVLSKDAILAALELHERVLALEITGDDGATESFETLCEPIASRCLVSSLYDIWGYNATVVESRTQEELLDDINAPNLVTLFGGDLELDDVVGGLATDDSGRIVGAQASLLVYFLEYRAVVRSGVVEDEEAWDWMEVFIDLVRDELTSAETADGEVQYTVNALRSIGDEFSDAIGGDLNLVFVASFIIVIYLIVNLGNFDAVESRVWLSLSAVACIGMATAGSIGLCSAFGLFYGPVHQLLSFLALGIGADDAFVIVNQFVVRSGGHLPKDHPIRKEREAIPLEKRISLAMAESGVAVSVTSLTDGVAFLVSSSTTLPALRSFSLYACVLILLLYFYVTTFFCACLALDARRQEAFRRDCCPCFVVSARAEAAHNDAEKGVEMGDAAGGEGNGAANAQTDPDQATGPIRRLFAQVVAPLVTGAKSSLAVVAFFVVFTSVMIYGATEVKQDFDARVFVPAGSYLLPFFDQIDAYFSEDPTIQIVITDEIEYSQETAQLEALHDAVRSSKWSTGDIDSWYEDFVVFAGGVPATEDAFVSQLQTYFETSGERYAGDVVFSSGGDAIVSSRFFSAHPEEILTTADSKVNAMHGMRREVRNSVDFGVFAYSEVYLDYESFAVMDTEFFQNLGVALAAIFLITLLLIASPTVSVLVFLCVTTTLTYVLGTMGILATIEINSVSVVMVSFGVGLSVDYSAHIGHAFLTKQGTRNQRVTAALVDVGPAVLNGATSTMLAILVLLPSTSYIFRVFSKMMLSIATSGVGVSFFLLPVLLSKFGPATPPAEAAVHPKM